jgi:glycosyltransferase involved in cell wall biosynthesis
MADFFAGYLKRDSRAHLLWLTNGSKDRVRELMRVRQIDESNFSVLSIASAEVPSYLAAADVGLAFIKRCISKLASSPTKNGEYLACGLPLVINAGVGDSDALINDWKAGVLIEEFTDAEFAEAGRNIAAIVAQPEVRKRARAVAEQLFDLNTIGLERYASLYERVLGD